MKKYHLIILYPSSNKCEEHQSYKVTVEADSVGTAYGNMQFHYERELIAAYPLEYTIIHKIEKI